MNTDVISEQVHQIPWMLTRLVEQTPGLEAAVCFSEEGLLTSMSAGVTRARAEELTTIGSALSSIASGAARRLELGSMTQVGIEMADGYLFVVAVADGSHLCVTTRHDADIGLVDYEMSVLAERFGSILTPEVRTGLVELLPT